MSEFPYVKGSNDSIESVAEYGEVENWGMWTPTLEEQENMLIEAELLADEEEAAAYAAFA